MMLFTSGLNDSPAQKGIETGSDRHLRDCWSASTTPSWTEDWLLMRPVEPAPLLVKVSVSRMLPWEGIASLVCGIPFAGRAVSRSFPEEVLE